MAKPTETAEFLDAKKRLVYFLKKEKVFAHYVFNLNNEAMKRNIPSAIESFIKSVPSMKVSGISGPFYWKDTKEGDAFWRKIHEKWMEYAKTF